MKLAALIFGLALPLSGQIVNPGGGGGGGTGAISYTTITPAPLSNVNLVGVGDSRMAGSSVPAGQGFLDYLALQPQFASRANFFNAAVGGDTCALMTTHYAANVQPHKPSGGITIAYLFIEEGINDINSGVALATLEACYDAYIATAVADGFTPILNTVYAYGSDTVAHDSNRLIFNDWIRRHSSYLVIDIDQVIPLTSPNLTNFWIGDTLHFNGAGNVYWAQAANFLWGLNKSGTTFAPAISSRNIFDGSNGFQFWQEASFSGDITANPTGAVSFGGSGLGFFHSWTNGTEGAYGMGSDGNCYLFRDGTGNIVIQSGCGPIGLQNNTTITGYVKPTHTVVGSLGSASTAGAGAMVTVSDANGTVGTCTGGGSTWMVAISDGTNWKCR